MAEQGPTKLKSTCMPLVRCVFSFA